MKPGTHRLDPWSFYPFVIAWASAAGGLLFSCWFFYIFWKIQLIFSSAMAWTCAAFHSSSSRHSADTLRAGDADLGSEAISEQMWLRIIGQPSELDDSGEAMSYRVAASGAILGTLR